MSDKVKKSFYWAPELCKEWDDFLPYRYYGTAAAAAAVFLWMRIPLDIREQVIMLVDRRQYAQADAVVRHYLARSDAAALVARSARQAKPPRSQNPRRTGDD